MEEYVVRKKGVIISLCFRRLTLLTIICFHLKIRGKESGTKQTCMMHGNKDRSISTLRRIRKAWLWANTLNLNLKLKQTKHKKTKNKKGSVGTGALPYTPTCRPRYRRELEFDGSRFPGTAARWVKMSNHVNSQDPPTHFWNPNSTPN